ncbi:acyl-CoA thioesterase [Aquicella lusitana]|uniref:Acyl-CoA thioesterase YciA n=1 Tax=Aquicella lusitana TaxID=254246 RepID=A0A370GLC8_9COXI|nr:acyl-CoA thioesterase [Aquicella lusitana]RDI42693.1 acyl-CoA thioesterase YciA [Aquicella lusitana]VVC73452.1 putative acyl-CoA thioester hydrolase [Aquicella lusitana]
MSQHEDIHPKGQLVIQTVAMPADTNAHGDIFGGWLVSHMDMGAGIAARHRARSRCVTVAIDSMTFIKRVLVGDTVCCYADILKVGRTSMQIQIEVWTNGLVEDKHKKVAEGVFTFVAIDDHGKPHPVDR